MKNFLRYFLFIIVLLIATGSVSQMVFAQAPTQGNDTPLFTNPTGRPQINLPNPIGAFGDTSTLDSFFTFIVSRLSLFGGIIAFGFFLYGGFRYITAGGNPQSMDSARRIIIGSIIGIFIMGFAYLIVHEGIALINCILGNTGSCLLGA